VCKVSVHTPFSPTPHALLSPTLHPQSWRLDLAPYAFVLGACVERAWDVREGKQGVCAR